MNQELEPRVKAKGVIANIVHIVSLIIKQPELSTTESQASNDAPMSENTLQEIENLRNEY